MATRSADPSETGAFPHERHPFNGPNNKNPPELSPIAFYERIFGSTFKGLEEGVVDPTLALRRGVLDAVMADVEKINARVRYCGSHPPRSAPDGHPGAELRLARLAEDPPSLEACLRRRSPRPNIQRSKADTRSQIHRAMTDLLVMAVACDQTLVFSHWFSDPLTNNKLYPGGHDGSSQPDS